MRLSAARSVNVHAFGFRRSPFRRPTGTPWVLLQRSCRPLLFILSIVCAAVVPTGARALNTSATSIASSVNPSASGQSVTFTATVVDFDGHTGTPTGTVDFKDGAATIGSGTLDGSGQTTFTTSLLSAGDHTITAQYNGDVNFDPSSDSLTQHVLGGTTTLTSLSSSLNPSTVGQSVNFTATVSGITTPTGTVTFTDTTTATVLATVALNGAGQASVTTSALTVGDHNITADYSGDAPTFDPSSGSLTQHVLVKSTSATALSSSQNPSVFGQSVTFTAIVSDPGGHSTPTGSVTFMDGATTLGTVTLDGAGEATFTTSTLSVGPHTITANYSGDSTFNTSSDTLTQTVNQSGTTTTLASSLNPSGFGQSVTFTATVAAVAPGTGTPTGSVTFKDGAIILGTGTLDGSGQASFTTSSLSLGSHTITAEYGGATNYAASTSAPLTQVVAVNSTTTTLVSSQNPSTFGQSVTFIATVTDGATPTGTVTFKDGATTLGTGTLNGSGQATFATSSLSVGSHTITAEYGGDGTHGASTSAPLTQVVNVSGTTVTLASSQNPSTFGQSVTFTATVTDSGTPTGTVTFKDGATTLGTGTLNGSGQASFATSSLSVGSHTITAEYGGDGTHGASTSAPLTQVVNVSGTTVTLASSQNPSTFGQSVTFTATVTDSGTPTGTVTFKDGATTLGTGTLNGSGQATFATSSLSAGSHSITAEYGGDGTHGASTSAPLTQTVNRSGTTVTLASSQNPSTFGQSVTFTATVTDSGTPTGTVTFKDGATTLGTGTLNGSGQATFATSSLSAGSHSITAEYGGDANHAASTSAPLTQTVNKSGTTTTLVSSQNPSAFGQAVTFTATVTSSGGTPTGTVTFKDGASTLGTGTLSGAGVATFTTSTLALGNHPITAVYGGDGSFTGSTSAVLTQSVDVPADSLKLRAMQIAGSKLVAQSSGAAISGAIGSAVMEGFEDGGEIFALAGNGVRVNFAAEAQDKSRKRARVDDAFSALAYAAGARKMITKAPKAAPLPPPRDWLAWAEVRGTGWNTDPAKADITGGRSMRLPASPAN